MGKRKELTGHLLALLTVFIWGVTYISSKVLLRILTPEELLIMRFVIGYGMLWILKPKLLKFNGWKKELAYAGAGLTGICLYYLLENISLTYTLASNVGVIIVTAPFFTALLAHAFHMKGEKLTGRFFIGFVIAMTGICLISFGGSGYQMHLFGDLLALLASFVWSLYCVISKKVFSYGDPLIPSTRRIFFYGVIFMVVPVTATGFHPPMQQLFSTPKYCLNLLFLGVVACAVCFVLWNAAEKAIGAIRASVYIYLTPVVTVLTSVWILGEKITFAAFIGILLTMAGLVLSRGRQQNIS